MKRFAGLLAFFLLLSSMGLVSAKEVTVVDPFPEGSVFSPVASEDVIIFGDIQVSIISNETDGDGNRTVQLQIMNGSNTTLWIEPSHITSFKQGLFNNDGKHDGGDDSFFVESMKTSEGTADIAYEWYMALAAGGTGTIVIKVGAPIEMMCIQPFHTSLAGLTDDATARIHGCWLLED